VRTGWRFPGGLVALLFALSVGQAGCGQTPTGSPPSASAPDASPAGGTFYEDPRRGYSVTIPHGWHRSVHPLADLSDPVEILVAATYEPRVGGENCGPLEFGGFDGDEVLVTVLERGLDAGAEWADFPPRPAHFTYEPGRTSEFASCLRDRGGIPLRDDWFTFTDAGRHFHVLVAIGADAPHAAAVDAYRMLDSLRFDPGVRPDWRSSG
jgi:hypothetical protein